MEKDGWEMPSDVLAVHTEIEAWREKRKKRGPIPSSIWFAASALAKRYGEYRISQALRLNYGALKRRLLEAYGETGDLSKVNVDSGERCDFVELTGVEPMGVSKEKSVSEAPMDCRSVPSFGMEIEVSDNSGSRMTVRVMENNGVDIPKMVSAFWSRSS